MGLISRQMHDEVCSRCSVRLCSTTPERHQLTCSHTIALVQVIKRPTHSDGTHWISSDVMFTATVAEAAVGVPRQPHFQEDCAFEVAWKGANSPALATRSEEGSLMRLVHGCLEKWS